MRPSEKLAGSLLPCLIGQGWIFVREQWHQRLFNALRLIRSVLHNSSTHFQAKLVVDRPGWKWKTKQLVHKILSVHMVWYLSEAGCLGRRISWFSDPMKQSIISRIIYFCCRCYWAVFKAGFFFRGILLAWCFVYVTVLFFCLIFLSPAVMFLFYVQCLSIKNLLYQCECSKWKHQCYF